MFYRRYHKTFFSKVLF